MARTALTDYLQNYPFWLCDVAPIEPLSLPIFTPLLGFSSITAPEVTVEVNEITEANWFFTSKTARRGSASNMTLMRASKWYDSDFYKWILSTLAGNTGGRGRSFALSLGGATPRRNLLLVHYLSRSPFHPALTMAAGVAGMVGLTAATMSHRGGGAGAGVTGFASVAQVAAAGGVALSGNNLGPFQYTPRIPAKAWLLYGCLPVRYKAGSDFDAMSSDISVQELEIAVEYWDEISMGSEAAQAAKVLAVKDAFSDTAGR